MEIADLVLLWSLGGFGVAPHEAVIHQRRTKTTIHHGLTVYMGGDQENLRLGNIQHELSKKWDWATSRTSRATRTEAFPVHKILRSSCPWNLTFGYKNLINSSSSQNGRLCQIWEDALKVLLSRRQTGPDCYAGVKMALYKSVCALQFSMSPQWQTVHIQLMTHCDSSSSYISSSLSPSQCFFFPTNLKKFPSRCYCHIMPLPTAVNNAAKQTFKLTSSCYR